MTKLNDKDIIAKYEFQNNFFDHYLFRFNSGKTGWWEREFCEFLQWFEKCFREGKRPIAYMEAPVQHGKTTKMLEFITWMAGKYQDKHFAYACASDNLRKKSSRKARKIFKDPRYKYVFGDVGGETNTDSEYSLKDGSVNFLISGGEFTGFPVHILVVDDPYGKEEDAWSEVKRESVQEWFTGDALSRLQDQFGVIVMHSRLQKHDLIGWLKKNADFLTSELGGVVEFRGFSFPALATQDEKYRKTDDPLFPELRSKDFLQMQRALKPAFQWESQYQQQPMAKEDMPFDSDMLQVMDEDFKIPPTKKYAIFDPANEQRKSSDFTAGVVIGIDENWNYYLHDMIHDKIKINDRIDAVFKFKNRWQPWATGYEKYGMQSDIEIIRMKAKEQGQSLGYFTEVKGIMSKNDRIKRLDAILQPGKLFVPKRLMYRRIWDGKDVDLIQKLRDEMDAFPQGEHDDILDVVSRIFDLVQLKEPFKNEEENDIRKSNFWKIRDANTVGNDY